MVISRLWFVLLLNGIASYIFNLLYFNAFNQSKVKKYIL